MNIRQTSLPGFFPQRGLACVALAFTVLTATNAFAQSDSHDSHETRQIQGWTIHLNKRLPVELPDKTARGLELIDAQLRRVVDVIPAKALSELRKVPVWVNPQYKGEQPRCEYHPGAGWLRDNGRDPVMAKAIEVSNIANFEFEDRRMPYLMLHELAHAYHDRVLGFDRKEVVGAFREAKESGIYDTVQRFTGRKIVKDKAYALSNHKEYFAENTEAYFGRNDFFPFNRKELQSVDPHMVDVIRKVWGDNTTASDSKTKSIFLIGNSLTWDTVPSKLDGDIQWHVDCGKSLPWMIANPQKPCVNSSTLWPTALKQNHYDVLAIQVHYRSTLAEDLTAIGKLIQMQPTADVVIHTGWPKSEFRVKEWASTESKDTTTMTHSRAWFDALLSKLRTKYPERTFRRTKAMDILQQIDEDIKAGKAPIKDVTELYRDAIHMNVVTGRYLMHNAMRHALGLPRSAAGFSKLSPEMKPWLDNVLDRVAEVK